MDNSKTIFLILCISLIVTSCGKKAQQGRMVPKDASLVVVINTKSFTSKVSWADIQQTSWYRDKSLDSTINSWQRKLMENPKLSGVDYKADQVFFALKKGDLAQGVFIGDINDEQAFSLFIRKVDSTVMPTKEGNLNFMRLYNRALIGWNNKKFVFIAQQPVRTPDLKFINDTTADTTTHPAPVTAGVEVLAPLCKRIFELNADSSLYKDEKFVTLINEDGDLHLWVNIGQLSKGSMPSGILGMVNLNKFTEGNIATATISFNDGKITAKQKSYGGKELTDVLKKYNGGNTDADMLKNIPDTNLDLAVAVHFRPEVILELIKLTGLDGIVNLFMGQLGISMDDFMKANKGDLQLVASDLKLSSGPNDTSNSNTLGNGTHAVLAISVADKNAFDKLISAGKKLTGSKANTLAYRNTGKYFIVAFTQKDIDQFLTGNKTSSKFTDKLKDHPAFAFVDLQHVMNVFQPPATDSSRYQMFTANKSMWDNFTCYGGEFSDGCINFTLEINLQDKTTNSLKQLNTYLDKLYLARKSGRSREVAISDTIRSTTP